MKRRNLEAIRWSVVLAAGLACSLANSWADVDPNRYGSIVERNPFGLKPPPPPPDPNANPPAPPPPPPATVELTGIISGVLPTSPKKALLEIIPGPGKQLIRKLLNEGEREESVEVVSIDVTKGEVVIKNGTLLTNIGLKVVKSGGPTGPGPGQPGQPGGSVVPVKPITTVQQPPPNYSGQGGRGVVMAGGNPSYQETTPAANSAAVNPNAAASNPGFRSIPSRTIRTGGLTPPAMPVQGQPYVGQQFQPGQQVQTGQPVSPEQSAVDPAQAYLNSKAQAEWARQRQIIMPPPPSIPGVE